jgi:hypothetical protein
MICPWKSSLAIETQIQFNSHQAWKSLVDDSMIGFGEDPAPVKICETSGGRQLQLDISISRQETDYIV